MTDTPPPRPVTPHSVVIGIIRLMGAIFVAAGAFALFDPNYTVSQGLGISDVGFRQVIGAMFLVMGLVDFFVIPPILRRSGKAPGNKPSP
jgi:hypothetical protein